MIVEKIRPRVRDSILQALAAGVVPSVGIQHIQVGRVNELKGMIRDVERIADGGSAFRLIVGDYGAGKSFFLQVTKTVALKQNLVVVHADLSPERRLVATGGQARLLYSELICNMAHMHRAEGGALGPIIETFVAKAMKEATAEAVAPEALIERKLSDLQGMVGGYDIAKVIGAYCKGHCEGREHLKQYALRWLRGEYTTKPEATRDLGVRTIIDDSLIYDALKLMARFVTLAGYRGLMVILDEGVNLYKISNTAARTSNYEMVLRILNDCLQGQAKNFGVLLGITPEALQDRRRGLSSYEALASRLAPNQFSQRSGLVDYAQPTITLNSLSPEELFLLLRNVTNVFSSGSTVQHLIDDLGIEAFMKHCHQSIGDAYFRTPRETVRAFVQLLSLLEQYPDKTWKEFIRSVSIGNNDDGVQDECSAQKEHRNTDELAEFTL